jgi:hypothetical protein
MSRHFLCSVIYGQGKCDLEERDCDILTQSILDQLSGGRGRE